MNYQEPAYSFNNQQLHSNDIENFLYEDFIDENGVKQRKIKDGIVEIISEEDLKVLLNCISLINNAEVEDNNKIIFQRKSIEVMNRYNMMLNPKRDEFGENVSMHR